MGFAGWPKVTKHVISPGFPLRTRLNSQQTQRLFAGGLRRTDSKYLPSYRTISIFRLRVFKAPGTTWLMISLPNDLAP